MIRKDITDWIKNHGETTQPTRRITQADFEEKTQSGSKITSSLRHCLRLFY
jgi:hypothetical protein